jgi:hypothetical protein
MFSLQVLGAVAQLERALIAERTKAGLLARISHTHHDSYGVASTSIPIPN